MKFFFQGIKPREVWILSTYPQLYAHVNVQTFSGKQPACHLVHSLFPELSSKLTLLFRTNDHRKLVDHV